MFEVGRLTGLVIAHLGNSDRGLAGDSPVTPANQGGGNNPHRGRDEYSPAGGEQQVERFEGHALAPLRRVRRSKVNCLTLLDR